MNELERKDIVFQIVENKRSMLRIAYPQKEAEAIYNQLTGIISLAYLLNILDEIESYQLFDKINIDKNNNTANF